MDLPRLSGQRRSQLAQATERYHSALRNAPGSQALDYLKGRGISKDVATQFKLGFVAEPIEGHDRFVGRLAIPYLTPTGVVGMRFRGLTPEFDPKYDSESGQRTALYNVNDLHRSEPWIAICEGELDTVVMSGIVGVPAVGVPGIEHWFKKTGGEIWRRLFVDYDAVYVVTDPDKAGQKAAQGICKQIENAIPVDLPADVNDTVTAHGADYILEKLGLD